MVTRYKNAQFQNLYETLLRLAANEKSDMYTADGRQHGGANVRCAFWDGFNGRAVEHRIPRGTMLAVAFAAGKDFAKQQAAPVRRGRPPKHLPGTDRVALSTLALERSGGARKTYRLSARAMEAMQLLLQQPGSPKTQTALIEQLLVAAAAPLGLSEMPQVGALST